MSQRGLLIVGVAAIAASLLIGVAGTAGGVNGGSFGGMMGGLFSSNGGQNIGIDRAVAIAQGVAGSYSGGGLAVDEVIEFSNNYYASIREKSTAGAIVAPWNNPGVVPRCSTLAMRPTTRPGGNTPPTPEVTAVSPTRASSVLRR